MARNTSKWVEMAPNGSEILKPLKKPGFGGRLAKKQENLKKKICGRRNGLKLRPP